MARRLTRVESSGAGAWKSQKINVSLGMGGKKKSGVSYVLTDHLREPPLGSAGFAKRNLS